MGERRIYLILPYYGQFPNYFQLYLDSVAINRDILTIIIITDINTSNYSFPENVIICNLTIDNIRERLSAFLLEEYNISIPYVNLIARPYKMCDTRVIYHKLFNDILNKNNVVQNDYIGWGDCDVIYGKLSMFIDLTKDYKIIGHHGHFTAMLNHTQYTDLYKKIENFKELVSSNINMVIDERAWRNILFQQSFHIFYMWKYFCDVKPSFGKNIEFISTVGNKRISYLHFSKNNQSLTVHYEDGTQNDTTYAHLQKRPMQLDFTKYDDSFYILKDRFIDPTLDK